MISLAADIEQRIECRRLTGRGQHSRRAALKSAYLRRDRVVRRVLEPCVEIAALGKIEQTPHLLDGVVFVGRRLVDRQDARLAVLRCVAALHADRV